MSRRMRKKDERGHTRRCICKVCRHSRSIRKILPQLDRRGRTLVEGLYERMCHAEEDAVYWELKYKGQWAPS